MNVHYVCKDETDHSAKTIFELRQLTFGQYNNILSLQEEGKSMEAVVLAVRSGIAGWSNLIDDHDQPVLFSPDSINRLPSTAVQELGEQILIISNIDEQTRNELIGMARFSEFLAETKTPEIWTCDWCEKNGKKRERD